MKIGACILCMPPLHGYLADVEENERTVWESDEKSCHSVLRGISSRDDIEYIAFCAPGGDGVA